MGLATTWLYLGLVFVIVAVMVGLSLSAGEFRSQQAEAMRDRFDILDEKNRGGVSVSSYSPSGLELWLANTGATREKLSCIDVYRNDTYLSTADYSLTLLNDSFDPVLWNPGETLKLTLSGLSGMQTVNATVRLSLCGGATGGATLTQPWASCANLTLSEADGVERESEPLVVNLSGLSVADCSEVRILNATCDAGGFEVAYRELRGDDETWCEVVLLADAAASDDTVYGIYHNYTGAPAPTVTDWPLLLYLPFDESAGTAAPDKSGEGLSFSFADGGTWTDTGCRYDNCLAFDGDGDYLYAADPGGDFHVSEGDTIALFAWVKREPDPMTMTVFKRNASDPFGTYLLDAYNGSGGIGSRFRFTDADAKNHIWEADVDGDESPQVWHLYGAIHTYNATNASTWGALDDAVKNGSWVFGDGDALANQSNPTSLCIAADCRSTTTYYLNGTLDDLTIWNRNLTEQEVVTLSAPNKLTWTLSS